MIQNIVITSAGRRVSLVKSFQKTLKQFNPNGKVFVVEMNPTLSSAAHVADGYKAMPRVSDPNYLFLLKSYCIEHNISLVIPTIDTELSILAEAKESFLEVGVTIVISTKDLCDTFYLKTTTEKFFLQKGFDTPKQVALESATYPLFAKLDNSSCSIGAKVVSNQEEAFALLQENKEYVFQEYIQGDEYTVDVCIDKEGTLLSVVPRLRIEVRAGEVNKAKTVCDSMLIDEVKQLCKTLKGAYGVLTIQLFKTQDRIVFIEINPRFGGGYPLTYRSGANFAEYIIRDYLGEKLSYTQAWKKDLIMLRYDAEVLVDGSCL